MTGRKFVKLNMYRTVKQLCDENIGIIKTNAGFMLVYGKFTNGISLIETASGGASEVTTGITTDKDDDKATVCETATKIGGYVFAYASSVNNNTLKESVDFKNSVLYGMKKEELLIALNNVYTIANNNVTVVTDFGANPAALANFQLEIAAYKASVHSPRLAQTTKGTHNENLENLFKMEDTILTEQMDRVVKVFAEGFPDFVTSYGKARIIIDGPSGGKKDEKPAA
jgi:hypothetical protein